MKILILGISGMLGNTLFRYLSCHDQFTVFGSLRTPSVKAYFQLEHHKNIVSGVNIDNFDNLVNLFNIVRPNIVINCIGLIKQEKAAEDPLIALPINSLLPHKLVRLCGLLDARLIHMSTDCVFSGMGGLYKESDIPDANDLYGRSKYLGEVDYPNAITLRTSIIGHELSDTKSLVCWFLSQAGTVNGFRKAIFSGLPAIEIANVIKKHVIPNHSLRGTYHLSVDPISKYDLLNLISKQYEKEINIVPDDSYAIDRSLNSDRFRSATGFKPKPWPELVKEMYEFK
jgi:dTDP-4-dehydrorhamnose reductase